MSELLDLGGRGLGRRHDALDAGWRGAMLRALGLRGAELQWVPGALDASLAGTTAGLSALADRVPPGTATAPLAAPGGMAPRWSDLYRRLLGALLPEIEVGLRGCLGDAYPGWVRYRNAAAPEIPQRVLFRRWADATLSEGLHDRACRLFDTAARDPVSRARDAFGAMRFHEVAVGPAGRLAPVPAYGVSTAAAARALVPLHNGRIVFDSNRLIPGETGTLAAGGARSPALLPALCGDPFDPLDRRLAAARITVQGHVGARAMVPVAPGGWYDPETVRRARLAGACSTAWDREATAGGWAAFFGATGAMRRCATHLVLLSDMRVQLTIAGQFDDTEQGRLLAGLGLRPGVTSCLRANGRRAGGIWPFTIRTGRSALRATATADGAGNLRLDLVLPRGRFLAWGVRVGGLDTVA